MRVAAVAVLCATVLVAAVAGIPHAPYAGPLKSPAASSKGLVGFTGQCERGGTPLAWNDGDLFALMQGSAGELGHFRSCVSPSISAKYCTAHLQFACYNNGAYHDLPRYMSKCGNVNPLVPDMAFCMPENCGFDDFDAQLKKLSGKNGSWWGNVLQSTYGFGNPYDLAGGCMLFGEATALGCDATKSYAYLKADECSFNGNPLRETQAWKHNDGMHRMVIIMFVLTGLVCLATLVSALRLLAGFMQRLALELSSAESSKSQSSPTSAGHSAFQADDVSLASAHPPRNAAADEPLLKGRVNGSVSVEVPHGTNAPQSSQPRLQDGADDKPAPKSVPMRIASAFFMVLGYFDAIANVQNLFKVTKRHTAAVDTRWMEGVRVLSMAFVVYGHTLFFPQMNIGFENAIDGYVFLTTYAGIGVFPAELAVDAFFFMSGYLVYYLYHNAVEKQHKKDVTAWRKRQLVEDHERSSTGHSPHDVDGTGAVEGRLVAPAAPTSFASSPKLDRRDDDAAGLYSQPSYGAADSSVAAAPDPRPLTIPITLLMYLHRWLRIAPVMMLVIFFLVYIGPLVPSGPLYKTATSLTSAECITTGAWWRSLLFASDFDNPKYQLCAPWFWYLTCDFQMFLVAPLVCAVRFLNLRTMVPSAQWRSAVDNHVPRAVAKHLGHVLFYVVMSIFIVAGVAIATHYIPFGSDWYFSAVTRWSPYAFGVFFSALIRERWIRSQLDKLAVRTVLLFLGTVLAVGCINSMWKMNSWQEAAGIGPYLSPPQHRDPPSKGYLRGINFIAMALWGPALGCFSLAWGAGHGGWLVDILGHPVMVVLSKLTFCNYMIHPVLIVIFYASQDALPVFSQLNLYGHYFMFLPMTFTISALMHVAFELPAAHLNGLLAKLYR